MITLQGVSKYYVADKPALDDVNVEIGSGEFVFIVGHSGSGKSTFIRLLLRELTADARTDHRGRPGPRQDEELEGARTCAATSAASSRTSSCCRTRPSFENVAFALEVIGKSKHVIRTQVPEVLRLVGLEDKIDNYPDELSGGEQQRVSIARAFVNRPPLLLCDEPTGNLDPQTSLGIMKLLERINKTGTTVLVATHDRDMVDNMRRRVIALEGGRIIRDQDRGVYGYVD